MMFASSSSTWSLAVMVRAFTWKPRWAMIRRVNSRATSTLDDSRALLLNRAAAAGQAGADQGVPDSLLRPK